MNGIPMGGTIGYYAPPESYAFGGEVQAGELDPNVLTVGKLKELLSQYPDDMPVVMYDDEYGDHEEATEVNQVTVEKDYTEWSTPYTGKLDEPLPLRVCKRIVFEAVEIK